MSKNCFYQHMKIRFVEAFEFPSFSQIFHFMLVIHIFSNEYPGLCKHINHGINQCKNEFGRYEMKCNYICMYQMTSLNVLSRLKGFYKYVMELILQNSCVYDMYIPYVKKYLITHILLYLFSQDYVFIFLMKETCKTLQNLPFHI